MKIVMTACAVKIAGNKRRIFENKKVYEVGVNIDLTTAKDFLSANFATVIEEDKKEEKPKTPKKKTQKEQ